ncbi:MULTISPECIES: hypothetical protein [unclassified Microbacterium]|uniref:hypothetical protein n=1 Tax=unclassified Microbacterium TaxID=2609290 RepID=UPI003868973B
MNLPMIDVTIVLVAVATACAVILIGLGFLPFPSRASAIWSGAFASVMASSYLLVTADAIDASWLRAAANGPILCATGLVWVGLRARRGREPIFVVPTIVVFSALCLTLGLTATSEWYGLVFRLAFAAAAVCSALIAYELIRRVEPSLRDITAPLLVGSLGFVGLTGALLVEGAVVALSGGGGSTEVDLLPLRSLNELVASVYLICALVTLLGLSRNNPAQGSRRETTSFRAVAQDRLDRAKAAGDRWWSVLDIRLDDPADLLEASSGRAFDRVTSRFSDDIRAVLPPESDIHAVSPTQYLVLLPRPDTAVRALLSQLLERVATVTDQQAVPVRLSASIGVAAASLADYDIDRLSALAADAAEHAQVAGGDRWERAVFSS